MFVVNEDLSVSLNRGDAGIIKIPRKVDGKYEINTGDVLRLRIFPKKNCEKVELIKDYAVSSTSEYIELALSGSETRLGDVINKPTTYWYEIEQNPEWSLSDDAAGVYPKTIIGYDEDGPKVFLLYPEGDDSGDLPSENVGKKVNVSDEAVESIIENDIFKEYVDDKTRDITEKANTSLNTAKQIAETLQSKLENGEFKGDTGAQGEKGEAFTYEDFTPEQLASLKGAQGEKGDTGAQGEKGEAFTYEDFTPEQLASLKGAQGEKGDTGAQGEKGEAFTYEDFTPEQLASLKGEKGEAFTYAEANETVLKISDMIDKSVNLYNEKTNTTYNLSVGNERIECSETDFIYLSSGDYVITYNRGSNITFDGMETYSLNQERTQYLEFEYDTDIFTIENNLVRFEITEPCFVKFFSNTGIVSSGIMLVKGTKLPTEYVPYQCVIKSEYLSQVVSKLYSLDIKTLQSNGVLATTVNYSPNGTNNHNLIIAISFIPTIIDENGVSNKLIDAPFEFINVQGLIWSNKDHFKNVGISSPLITKQTGISGVVWFDTIKRILKNIGFNYDSITFELKDESKRSYQEGIVSIILTAKTDNIDALNYAMELWEGVFGTSGSKLIFEYQKQENTLTYDAPYLLDSPLTTESEV